MTVRTRSLLTAGLVLLFTSLLALDLANRGVAWRLFWSLTGEERPLAQLRGMVEWAGTQVRVAPRTEPLMPVQHAGVNPFGINTFLEQEVEVEKREQTLRMIAEAGFGWIRQQFPWEDIEIHGRGDFEDRRNIDVVGIISAWDKYDNIVALAEQYQLQILARLDNPPAWSHADPAIGPYAPPDDLNDFVSYAVTVAERYRGRLRYYQVWNEPNIYPEWGEQPVDPEAYTELLCRTYNALKAVDPSIVVVSGALSPTVALTGRDLSDLIFLQRMYDAGAAACFDVLAVQGYGFYSGPTDRRLRPMTLNFNRSLYIRDVMVANGDGHKPIWISEAAWNPIDAPEVPPDVSGRGNYGIVTREQAAEYMPLGYQRAIEEWPWVGMISYWFFKRAADHERGQSWYYFRMVEPDFTPLPVYETMRGYIASLTPTLHPGVHQAEHWAMQHGAGAQAVAWEGAQFETAIQTPEAIFTVYGTDLVLRWQAASPISVSVSDAPDAVERWRAGEQVDAAVWAFAEGDRLQEAHLPLSVLARARGVRISPEESSEPFIFDSVMVADRTAYHLFGWVVAAAIGIGGASGVALFALRARRT
ncbi:MAG: hypothetical protein SNJ59_14955 [Aggregatilineales bacterium]